MADILGMMDYIGRRTDQGVQQGKQTRLAGLYQQAMQGPRDQRSGLIAQMAGVSPQAAFDAEKHFGGMDDTARQRLGQYAAAFDALPDEQKQTAYPQLAKQAQELGIPAPPDWNPAYAPNIQKLAQALGGMGGVGTPTGFREFEMKARAAGLAPGTPEYQEAANIALGRVGRAATGGFGFEKVIGPDGRERMGRTNPRTGLFEVYDETTGGFAPMGGPAALNGVGLDSGGGFTAGSGNTGARVNIEGMPPEAQQQMAAGISALRQAGVSDAVIDAFATSAMSQPRMQASQSKPALGVSQSPAERKFAEESGQQAAQLQFLPEAERIKRESALAKSREESAIKPTKAQEAVDSQYGKEYVEFVQGGAADANKALSELQEVSNLLRKGRNLTGPLLGALPPSIKARTHPEAMAAQETVEATVQRSLRVILGAQFTEKEGERLIARAYNPALPEAENLKRVNRLLTQLKQGFENKSAAARYYEQNGTLRGFKGKLPEWSDFDPDGGGYQVGQVIEAGGKRYRVTGGDPNDPDVEEL